MPKLVECRNCGLEVSREAQYCPNNVCHAVYPSLSAVEMQKHYSHCISCNERLFTNNFVGASLEEASDPKFPIQRISGTCPKCGQPEPIREQRVPFPPPPKTSSCVYVIGIAVIIVGIIAIVFLILDSYMH